MYVEKASKISSQPPSTSLKLYWCQCRYFNVICAYASFTSIGQWGFSSWMSWLGQMQRIHSSSFEMVAHSHSGRHQCLPIQIHTSSHCIEWEWYVSWSNQCLVKKSSEKYLLDHIALTLLTVFARIHAAKILLAWLVLCVCSRRAVVMIRCVEKQDKPDLKFIDEVKSPNGSLSDYVRTWENKSNNGWCKWNYSCFAVSCKEQHNTLLPRYITVRYKTNLDTTGSSLGSWFSRG